MDFTRKKEEAKKAESKAEPILPVGAVPAKKKEVTPELEKIGGFLFFHRKGTPARSGFQISQIASLNPVGDTIYEDRVTVVTSAGEKHLVSCTIEELIEKIK